MIIGGFNMWRGELVIDNYPNLEKIVIRRNSLKNKNMLKICNNERLKIIEVEDDNTYYNYSALWNTKSVILESI